MMEMIASHHSSSSLVIWQRDFLEQSESDPIGFPFIVIANKLDLERKISKEQLEGWARANQIAAWFECSAINGEAVDAAFMFAAKLCANRSDARTN
jgi:hypothetical protein